MNKNQLLAALMVSASTFVSADQIQLPLCSSIQVCSYGDSVAKIQSAILKNDDAISCNVNNMLLISDDKSMLKTIQGQIDEILQINNSCAMLIN